MCRCNRIYSPVCGVDGVSYRNKCIARYSTRALPRCRGGCPCGGTRTNKLARGPGTFSEYFQGGQVKCSCTQSVQEVCGTDGQTYTNTCFANCKTGGKFRMQCWGPCPCRKGYCDNPNSASAQPQLNSTELGLTQFY